MGGESARVGRSGGGKKQGWYGAPRACVLPARVLPACVLQETLPHPPPHTLPPRRRCRSSHTVTPRGLLAADFPAPQCAPSITLTSVILFFLALSFVTFPPRAFPTIFPTTPLIRASLGGALASPPPTKCTPLI